MGNLEKESRKKTRLTNIQKTILASISVAGILAISVVAPNVISALGKMGIIKKPRYDSINRARNRLIERRLVESKSGFLRLTQKGESLLRKAQSSEYRIKKPRRWDNKWRVLIFDIKEEQKVLRNKLRETLTAVGFQRLQDSVWVYPHDCEDFIALLKIDFHFGKDVLYLIVDQMENDKPLRHSFGF